MDNQSSGKVSFWKVIGLVLTIWGIFEVSHDIILNVGDSSPPPSVDMTVIPIIGIALFVVSLVFLFLILHYSRAGKIKNLKLSVFLYTGFFILAMIATWAFNPGGIAYNYIHGTELECKFFSGSMSDSCYENLISARAHLARDSNDVSICNELSSATEKDQCTTVFNQLSEAPTLVFAITNASTPIRGSINSHMADIQVTSQDADSYLSEIVVYDQSQPNYLTNLGMYLNGQAVPVNIDYSDGGPGNSNFTYKEYHFVFKPTFSVKETAPLTLELRGDIASTTTHVFLQLGETDPGYLSPSVYSVEGDGATIIDANTN